MMSVPSHPQPDPEPARSGGVDLMRSALWVAIGALILAAIVCVVWVLIGPENGIIGRAFLTILLLAGFAGVAILDAHLAPGRAPWLVLASMVVWIVILLDGALLIWMPFGDYYFGGGITRLFAFALIVGLLQLALVHVRLYLAAHRRYVTGFTRAITWTTIALVAVLAVLLVLPLTFHEFIDFGELYWRIVVALTILAAVGTALIPLVNALFAPKKPRPARPVPGQPVAGYPGVSYPPPPAYPAGPGHGIPPSPGAAPSPATGAAPSVAPSSAGAPPSAGGPPQQPAPWPTYADGATPLPVLPDGSPDWNAYYTGHPTYPAAPPQPGYEGYPPAPPAPR